jgi:hypothetical protein
VFRSFGGSGAFAVLLRFSEMKPNVNAIERAFELARSGRCVTLKQIQDCLRAEGYTHDLIVGRYLSAQLRQLMREANPTWWNDLGGRQKRMPPDRTRGT